jgi:hypothetical protein
MRKILTISFLFVFAVGMMGCDSNGGGETPTAEVRFMHASPGAGEVSVVVGDETVLSGVPFSSTIASPTVSDYQEVPVGSNTSIQVQNASGSTILSTTAGNANLEEDTQYTIIVAGTPSVENSPQAIVLRDQFRDDLGSNQIGLRLVHGGASPALSPVDIYLNQPGTDLAEQELVTSDFEFGDDFPGGFPGQFAGQALSEDGSVLVVTPAGTTTPVLELPVGTGSGSSLPVQPGMHVTGVAIDAPGTDAPAGALVHIDTPGM